MPDKAAKRGSMLEEILIAEAATYPPEGQRLTGLKSLNFIFGANGSGKTTISRVIAAPSAYPKSSVTWKNGRSLDCLVYNRDFTEENFKSELPGIFTLGVADAQTNAAIAELHDAIQDIQQKIDGMESVLGRDDASGKRLELKVLRAKFEERCWQIKLDHEEHFRQAFAGLMNSKEKFCNRVLEELATNVAELEPLDSLRSKARTVFSESIKPKVRLRVPRLDDLVDLENNRILTKRIVGKEDIDIARLISKLGNSDWVKQGLAYLDQSEDKCPFCQQDLAADFKQRISDYFDEAFLTDMASLESLEHAYSNLSREVTTDLAAVLAAATSDDADVDALRAHVETLNVTLELNREHIRRKRKEPSARVDLDSVAELSGAIHALLESANDSIDKHNLVLENLTSEQATLKQRIWKRVLQDNASSIDDYTDARKIVDKAVDGLTAGLISKRQLLAEKQASLAALEEDITSVEPTVSDINNLLASFGFTSFSLTTRGPQKNFYAIVRADGSDATWTLSEGERSFITFLYFYHSLRGSVTSSGTNTDRIVVFDDPVSSMDSDVLFVVGALIRRIATETCAGSGNIKQVFVLTHNVYFHKEVSFDSKRNANQCRADETFWIVRKVDGISTLVPYTYNPIRTSYELLWAEVKNPNRSNITIQNVLRRILENYFRIIGNADKDKIVGTFQGRDQQICGSLFSWINDGSHGVYDDLYIAPADGTVEKYLDVFRRIFEETGHRSHYDMMMGDASAAASAVGPERVGV